LTPLEGKNLKLTKPLYFEKRPLQLQANLYLSFAILQVTTAANSKIPSYYRVS